MVTAWSQKQENSPLATGLLSGALDVPKYDEQLEALLADVYKSTIEARRWTEYRANPMAALAGSRDSFAFELRLVDFARARKISLMKPHWRSTAMYFAARDHPELKGKRGRGRPRKATASGMGILADLLLGSNATPDLDAVEKVYRIRQRLGKPVRSISEACKLIILMSWAEEGRSHDPENTTDHVLLENAVKQMRNRVSKQGGKKEIDRRLSQKNR